MKLESTLEQVRVAAMAAVAERAEELGLDVDRLDVSYVLNWGGFVNESFHVSDGATRYHLKLAEEREQVAGLTRWRALHELLHARFLAPRMTAWLDVPAMQRAGPLFEFVDGVMPEGRSPSLLENIAPMLARLHQDHELAGRLMKEGAPRSCLETFTDTYLERFHGDLALVDKARPPFLEPATVDWMRREIVQLERTASAIDGFREPARSAIHGDLWLNNILVTDGGKYVVLDWDDLSIGDPAMDWAMFLGPTARELRPLLMEELPNEVPRDAPLRARLAFYGRASMFDWVLDPLADWIDADAAPALAHEVRAEKERVHRAALASYREMYASA